MGICEGLVWTTEHPFLLNKMERILVDFQSPLSLWISSIRIMPFNCKLNKLYRDISKTMAIGPHSIHFEVTFQSKTVK